MGSEHYIQHLFRRSKSSRYILTTSSLDFQEREMTSSNQKEVMGYLASFILFFVFSQNSLAQSTDTIASRTSDGEYLAHVKGSNPIGYHKHWVTNTPDDQYIRLTGYNSAMVGNIKTDRKDAVQIVR